MSTDLETKLAKLEAENQALKKMLDLGPFGLFVIRYLVPVPDFITFSPDYFERLQDSYKWLFEKDQQRVQIEIKTMDYRVFLQTAYWRIIANHVRKTKGNVCAVCPATHQIQIHHRTYEHHGLELEFWKEDLTPLCDRCHSLVSTQFERRKIKKRPPLPPEEC